MISRLVLRYLRSQPGRRQVSVCPELELEFVEAIELRGEPVFDRLDAQAHGQVSLADTRRSLDQHGFCGALPHSLVGCHTIIGIASV